MLITLFQLDALHSSYDYNFTGLALTLIQKKLPLNTMTQSLGYNVQKLYNETIVKPIGWFNHATASSRILPSFFIVGVQKGGTTSLSKYIEQHPQIVPPHRKDIYFFNNLANYNKGINWYKAHFAHHLYKSAYDTIHHTDSITFDATSNYFEAPYAAEKLKQNFKNARIIIILRNPIDRAFSSYQMARRFGFEELSFEQALELEDTRLDQEYDIAPQKNSHSFVFQRLTYKKRGVYVNYIKTWMDLFKENLLIVKSEDFFDDTGEQMKIIQNFLGLKMFDDFKFDIFNKGDYHEKMDQVIYNKLKNFYEPYNKELYKLINRDFEWS